MSPRFTDLAATFALAIAAGSVLSPVNAITIDAVSHSRIARALFIAAWVIGGRLTPAAHMLIS
jgi:hypothetical protein